LSQEGWRVVLELIGGPYVDDRYGHGSGRRRGRARAHGQQRRLRKDHPAALPPRALDGCGARKERAHARWLRGSGPLAPSVNRRITMTVRAISTTDRRSTTRPCNLSPLGTQPASLRCALPSSRGPACYQPGTIFRSDDAETPLRRAPHTIRNFDVSAHVRLHCWPGCSNRTRSAAGERVWRGSPGSQVGGSAIASVMNVANNPSLELRIRLVTPGRLDRSLARQVPPAVPSARVSNYRSKVLLERPRFRRYQR